MKGLKDMTAAELVALHDRLDPGNAIVGPWKRSKDDLIRIIEAFGAPAADDAEADAAEKAADGDPGPEVTGNAAATVGALVEEMLVTDATYDEIVEAARGRFLGARTTRRSVASAASVMRRRSVDVPRRRIGRK